MQTVAAGWLMTILDSSAFMVALVQVATTAPLFICGLLAGAFADLLDRRKVLIGMQCVMFVAATFLAAATYFKLATPALLLTVSVVIGIGAAVSQPAWDTLVIEFADTSVLRESVTINAIGMNVARAVGPALAGLIISQFGTAPVFLLNALSFVGIALVALKLPSNEERPALLGERLLSNIRIGLGFVRYSPVLHPVMIRTFAFISCACCLSAVLPIFIKQQLQSGPGTLGLLFGFFGTGAIAGGLIIQKLKGKTDVAVNVATICGGIGLIALAESRTIIFAALACGLAGVSWLMVLANSYGTLQAASPLWMRGRIVSISMILMNGSIAIGSLLWGALASYREVSFALLTAGVLLLCTSLLHRLKFAPAQSRNVQPVDYWGPPAVVEEYVKSQQDRTPVNVVIEYLVPPENQEAFKEKVAALKRSRLRAGVIRWELCRDSEVLDKFIESFVAENWQQHLRHHRETLEEDRLTEAEVHQLLRPGTTPKTSHWTIEQC
jgi:MFS family permease